MSAEAREPSWRRWLAPWVVALGLAYAALSAWLAFAGERPSVAFGPIPAERYYAVQALFVGPLLVLGWQVYGRVMTKVAALPPEVAPAVRHASAGRYAGPLLLFVVADAVGYALGGFDALAKIIRISAPITLVLMWTLSAALLQRNGVRWIRAVLAAGAGLLVQALVVAPLLR